MAALNPAKFLREVRQEMEKVTWPTRKETIASTLMVIVLASIVAMFFVLVDLVVSHIINAIIGI